MAKEKQYNVVVLVVVVLVMMVENIFNFIEPISYI